AELGYLNGHDHAMVGGDRIIQSIEGMERACFQETNRLVRIRMLGGVGGVRSNAAPMPIGLLSGILRLVNYYDSSGHR
ncbi:MAG: hypothetical protein ACK5OC_17640, partial [Pirellula sp.]